MAEPIWCIMPFLNAPAMTKQAVLDLLAQSVPTRVLLIGQGADHETLDDLRVFAEQHHPRVLLWSWNPALPSLSACWNRALRFVWELGGTEALVVNNDVRLADITVQKLQYVLQHSGALFVSAVGVREADWPVAPAVYQYDLIGRGGPDYSCYLLSKDGHEKYPFDEGFIPAYGEDCDSHRRYMLGGDGGKIFSINLPFLHYASGTIKEYSPEARAKFNRAYEGCMAYYQRKWGGRPNFETLRRPFGEGDYSEWLLGALQDQHLGENTLTTTPELQHYYQIARRPTDVQAAQ